MDPKPGYQTTEFYMTLLTNLAAIFNLFHPSTVISSQVLSSIASFLVLAATTVAYIMGRSKVKATTNVSSVATTTKVETK